MDPQQKNKSTSKPPMPKSDQQQTKKSKSGSSTKKHSKICSFASFDSALDIGYKSGDLDYGKDNTSASSIKKEYPTRFDSGFGSDVFSPLPSESDIPSDSEAILPDPVPEQKAQPKLIWQNIYDQDKDGDTLLHLAIVEARSDVIFPLIRQAPHPDFLDICNDLFQTPLHLATLMGKSPIVRRLVAAGATLDIQDHNGNTALHLAARNGDLDCVLALLEPPTTEEIDDAQCVYELYPIIDDLSYLLNLKNYEGQASVHLASMGGFKKVLECLCEHGANVNDQEGKSGKTALHYAVESGNLEVVQILVCKCRANISAGNYAMKSALNVAWSLCKNNSAAPQCRILEFLKEHTTDSASDMDSSYSDEDDDDDLIGAAQRTSDITNPKSKRTLLV